MDEETLVRTRLALHAVAELVLAGPQYRASGTIRLRVCPGGFETEAEPRLRVDGPELVVGGRRYRIAETTVAVLSRAAGITPSDLSDVYDDGPGIAVGDDIDAEPGAAWWIIECLAAGDEALCRLAPGQTPVLWPEHFDVAVTVDGVGYGVSPGDRHHAEPYAYVGLPAARRTDPPTDPDGFWNAPFGALRPMRELDDADGVHAFFVEGRRRAALTIR
ncbi:MAG TPA: hypothetical protein VLJ59_02450 [Mycobacteriales bacterium]|nr:hypothetical protein [Mycobacteriales bacterium]